MPWGANTGRTAPGSGFDPRHSRQPLDPEHHLPSGMRGRTSRPIITLTAPLGQRSKIMKAKVQVRGRWHRSAVRFADAEFVVTRVTNSVQIKPADSLTEREVERLIRDGTQVVAVEAGK